MLHIFSNQRGELELIQIFKNMYCEVKSRAIRNIITRIDQEIRVFQLVYVDIAKYQKNISVLARNQSYASIIEQFYASIKKANEHNGKYRILSNQCESYLKNSTIRDILANIESFPKSRLLDMLDNIECVYTYIIPETYPRKNELDYYRKYLNSIIDDYEIIQKQYHLARQIQHALECEPDEYLDENKATAYFAETQQLIDEFNSYARKYYEVGRIDAQLIEQYNQSFIKRHLRDSIFDDISGRSLDDEQRRAVLCDARSNLVVAGAGSGKTLTICGKIKYLLEIGAAQKDEILVLSYSKASADDLKTRLTSVVDGVSVYTFHALGLNILTEVTQKKQAVNSQLGACVSQFFNVQAQHDFRIANEVFQYIALYFYANAKPGKKYKNKGELYEQLKSADYCTLKNMLGKLSRDRIRRETLQKEYVKSNEELVIANFLFVNGIHYEYERPYEIRTSTSKKRQYMPDFYLTDYGIYLEHYGIDRTGKAPQYEEEEGEKYIQSIEWKRNLHRENHTICIETYSYEFQEDIILDNLKKRLLKYGVKFSPLSNSEVNNALNNVYKGHKLDSLMNVVMTFVSLYKAQNTTEEGFDRLFNQLNATDYNTNRSRLLLNICRDVYRFYTQKLRDEDTIDFDDMILQSIELLDFTDSFKFKYIIVDEFQDISQSRTRFLQKLIQHGHSKLFAVGDDWQAIYRFAGCDINVFLKFKDYFPGARINCITSTHRNSDELQRIVEPFITANPKQFKKHIRSSIHQNQPVRIVYYRDSKQSALTIALRDIYALRPDARVLLLGRNFHDIDLYADENLVVPIGFSKGASIIHIAFPTLQISYTTIHSAKGIEEDFVVLISGEDALNGFPNKVEDDDIISLVLGEKDTYKYAEERRLFYVALTRTRSIVYLLANKDRPSVFVREIEDRCMILADCKENEEEFYTCPACGSGHLLWHRGKNGGFYGCTNFPYCKYQNHNAQAVRNNNRCPRCGDYLTVRNGIKGKFWGCCGYPECRYTQPFISHHS